jgi:hypothetical protein
MAGSHDLALLTRPTTPTVGTIRENVEAEPSNVQNGHYKSEGEDSDLPERPAIRAVSTYPPPARSWGGTGGGKDCRRERSTPLGKFL